MNRVLALLFPFLSLPAMAAPLTLISESPEMAGRQAQRPLWAPGPQPRLVHELTDRDKSSFLRIVTFQAPSFAVELIPGTRSARMESLGGGAQRADGDASWWDENSLFLVRSEGGVSRLYYYDGRAREVAGLPGRPEEIAADKPRGAVLVTLEDEGGLDLHRASGEGFVEQRRRLTRTETEVEASLAIAPSGRVWFVRVTSEGTGIGYADPSDLDATDHPQSAKLKDHELLSLTPLQDGSLLVYARVPAGAPEGQASHVLLEVTPEAWKVIARDCFLPPGLAPEPAISHGGRYVYYIANDVKSGNPVMRLDRASGKATALPLGTRGNQEVAIGEYPDAAGAAVPWVAVVAIGDDNGRDVRNHLYAGPAPGAP